MVAATGAAVIVIAALVALITSTGGPSSQAERVASARAAASEALDGLQLVEIEYGQAVQDGRIVVATEYDAAGADVQRAKDALAKHHNDLRAIDPRGVGRANRAIDAVRAAVDRRVTSTELKASVAAARRIIESLGDRRQRA